MAVSQILGRMMFAGAALVAYLLQLDRQDEDNPGFDLFADGFESGDIGAWSSANP